MVDGAGKRGLVLQLCAARLLLVWTSSWHGYLMWQVDVDIRYVS